MTSDPPGCDVGASLEQGLRAPWQVDAVHSLMQPAVLVVDEQSSLVLQLCPFH